MDAPKRLVVTPSLHPHQPDLPAGLGLTLRVTRGAEETRWEVASLASGFPAAASAAVAVGDRLLAINGQVLGDLPDSHVRALLRGEEGSRVSLRLVRAADGREADVALSRQQRGRACIEAARPPQYKRVLEYLSRYGTR